MILFKDYRTEAEAYIDKGLLEDNGINCVIMEDALTSIYPAPDSTMGRVSLYIEDDKVEEACRLLSEKCL